MIIAQQKRRENIIEYILYMWQLEDMLRAVSFDVSRIINQYDYPDETMQEIRTWYEQLVQAMHNEGIKEKGHLAQLRDLVLDLSSLNIQLLQSPSEKKYQSLFNEALPHISEVIQKSGNTIKNEIEACLIALYGTLLLRLQKKEVSQETTEAVNHFSRLMALLSRKYIEHEQGEL
ncbi:MAG: DUF4924 family protein [Bacteroidales bacterium]